MNPNKRWFLVYFSLCACGADGTDPAPGTLFGDGQEPGGVNAPVQTACIALAKKLPTDYSPGADDDWPACISDDGKFHPINPDISAVARTKVFEEIGALLFREGADGSPADFLAARKLYDEDEGIGSRVVRRYDPHYQTKEGADCTKAADVEANPDYCAGPAKILRIVQAALKNGYEGKEPRWQAGRLEGALLWFSTISAYKETLSCAAEKLEDCDSAYGYYDGAGLALGLGRHIREVDPKAYAAAVTGALAVRCWRDVDDAVPATNLTLSEAARTQFDRAVVRGALSVLQARIGAAEKAAGAAQGYHWGFVTAYLGAVQSQAYRSKGARDILAAARSATAPARVDLSALRAALKGMADCTP